MDNKYSLKENDLDAFFLKVHEINNDKMITIQLVNDLKLTNKPNGEIEEKPFQFKMTLSTDSESTFKPKPLSKFGDDEDARSSRLIYREVKEYATGHNCSASWTLENDIVKIYTNWMPEVEVKSVNPNGDKIFSNYISKKKLVHSASKIYSNSDEEVFELLDY